jgi:formylglycine-generating enzyme required for sulfatase activity
MTRAPRPPIKLADSVQQQLNMYALAAGRSGSGSAGVSATCRGEDCLHARTSCHQIARYPKGPPDSFDPAEPGIPKRVQRGGSFLCSEQYCTRYMVGARGKGAADTGTNHVGFR